VYINISENIIVIEIYMELYDNNIIFYFIFNGVEGSKSRRWEIEGIHRFLEATETAWDP